MLRWILPRSDDGPEFLSTGKRVARRPGSTTPGEDLAPAPVGATEHVSPLRRRDAFEARRSLASPRLVGDLGVALRLHSSSREESQTNADGSTSESSKRAAGCRCPRLRAAPASSCTGSISSTAYTSPRGAGHIISSTGRPGGRTRMGAATMRPASTSTSPSTSAQAADDPLVGVRLRRLVRSPEIFSLHAVAERRLPGVAPFVLCLARSGVRWARHGAGVARRGFRASRVHHPPRGVGAGRRPQSGKSRRVYMSVNRARWRASRRCRGRAAGGP